MNDQIAEFFLFFNNTKAIIPMLLIGYIWINKKTFYNAMCIILFGMMLNAALKCTFRIPLNESLHKEGFAFPSGHMQAAIVTYGWLSLKTPSKLLKILVFPLWVGIAMGMVHFDYHNYYDILGGVCSGGLLLLGYNWMFNKRYELLPIVVTPISTAVLFYINAVYKIEDYVWLSYYCIAGLFLSEKIFSAISKEYSIINKVMSTVVCLSILITARLFSKYLHSLNMPNSIAFIHWVFVGFVIPFSGVALNSLLNRCRAER